MPRRHCRPRRRRRRYQQRGGGACGACACARRLLPILQESLSPSSSTIPSTPLPNNPSRRRRCWLCSLRLRPRRRLPASPPLGNPYGRPLFIPALGRPLTVGRPRLARNASPASAAVPADSAAAAPPAAPRSAAQREWHLVLFCGPPSMHLCICAAFTPHRAHIFQTYVIC